MKKPRLKDQGKPLVNEPYPLNAIPNDIIVRIGAHFVFLLHTGRQDFSRED